MAYGITKKWVMDTLTAIGAGITANWSGIVGKPSSAVEDIDSAVTAKHTAHSDDQDLSGLVVKESGKSLVADTEIAKIHESGSDNQDLSGLVVKETGKSLVSDSEISKIHSQNTDTGASGDFDIIGELGLKVYSSPNIPILGANNRVAIWIDTGDSNKVYIVIKKGTNDQFAIELIAKNPTVADAPTGLTATKVTANDILVEWVAPVNNGKSAIIGYKIERESPIGGGFSTLVANTGTTEVSYHDTSVTEKHQYNYKVSAINAVGIGSASNEAAPETFTVPGVPTTLAAIAVSDTEIDLTWVAPEDNGGTAIIGYKIERESPIDGGWATIVADTGSTDVTYANTELTAETQYNYRVSAINAKGEGSPSNEDDATTEAAPAAFVMRTTSFSGSFTLPTVSGGVYDCVVDWGDGGPTSVITAYDDADRIHNYLVNEAHDISITGTCTRLDFNAVSTSATKIAKILASADLGFNVLKFQGCTNLTEVCSLGPLLSLTNITNMFNGCSSLTTVPADLYKYTVNVTSMTYTFANSALASIPIDFLRYMPGITTMNGCFNNCFSLTAIPAGLWDYNLSLSSAAYQGVAYCFCNDSNLTGLAPTIWLREPAPQGESCFTGAVNLTNYADIPELWKA